MKHPFSDTYITNFKLVLDVIVDRIYTFLAGLVIDNKLAILVQLIAAFVDQAVGACCHQCFVHSLVLECLEVSVLASQRILYVSSACFFAVCKILQHRKE